MSRHKNFNLVLAYKPKFGLVYAISVSNFFLAPFLSFFPARLLSLPSACHIFSGCREKGFVLIIGEAWKWDLDLL